MTTKKIKKRMCLSEKLKIVNDIEKGMPGRKVALKYGVGKSTVCSIKQKSERLKRFAANLDPNLLDTRKTIKPPNHEEFEQKLSIWVEKQLAKNRSVTQTVLCDKAKALFLQDFSNSSVKSFCASPGWYWKFKKRLAARGIIVGGKNSTGEADPLQPQTDDDLQPECFEDSDDGYVQQGSPGSQPSYKEHLNVDRRIEHGRAINSFEQVIQWALENHIERAEIEVLRELKLRAFEAALSSMEPTDIMKFLKKEN